MLQPKKHPYPLLFTKEVLDKVAGHEVYSFLDGFFDYHQIMIAFKDRYKTTFIIDWGAFVWVVMPFGLKNVPPTYQHVVNTTFKDYFGIFRKLFLDDFSVFNNLDTHLPKLQLCFDKCKELDRNLNPKKCMFLMDSSIILGYVVSKEGKLTDPKKILVIIHMPTLKTPKDIQVFNGMAHYYQCFIKDFAFIMAPITKLLQKTKAFEWTTECQQAWEKIKQCYMDAPILISPQRDIEFQVHTYVFNLTIEAMLA
jgi:hypothetical protein